MSIRFGASKIYRSALIMGVVVAASAATLPGCGAGDDGAAVADESSAITSGAGAADRAIDDATAPDRDFLITPVGRVHRSCVHRLADATTIDATGKATLAAGGSTQFAACRYSVRDDRRAKPAGAIDAASGRAPTPDLGVNNPHWFEFAGARSFSNGFGFDWFNGLTGTWTTPPAPRRYIGQTVFLFTALEPTAGNSILQPVIQYGPSAAGGGEFWSMAVWYISASGTVFTGPLQGINAGDPIEGDMTADTCDSAGRCTWNLTILGGWSLPSTLRVAASEIYQIAFEGVLEVYNERNCDDLPVEGDTGATFTNVQAYMPGPATYDFNGVRNSLGWEAGVQASGCSYGVIGTATGVELYWD